MDKFKVYVTREIPENGIDLLKRECSEVSVRPSEEVPSKVELMEAVKGTQALLCLLTDPIDSEVIKAGNQLKIIANYAVGYDNIDVAAATKKGIMVTNTPGVLTETTADMAWALLMSCARRVVEADKFVRDGRFKRWEPKLLLGYDIHGKTLGVIGFGRIGRAVAKRAKGFGMKVLYHDVQRADPETERTIGVEYVDLESLLELSDYITLHTPITPETHHLIGRRELKAMKQTALLINTSRGPVVDEGALIQALNKGLIAGAALDVYENEPHVPSELRELPNVVLTPHIASGSIETRSKMAKMAAENIIAAMHGQQPQNLVNTDVL